MKKYLLFIALLFVPFMVKAADVSIKEVTLEEATDYVEAEEHPTYEGLKINFNLKFELPGNYAVYRVVVKNDSKKDYEIDESTRYNDGEFIKYEIEYEGSNLVKAGEEKEFYIIITYDKEVSADAYENGKYVEKNNMSINLSEGDASSDQQNPYTATMPIMIMVLSVIAIVLLVIAYKKKQSLLVLFIIPLLIPFTIYALEKITINMETNIEIDEIHGDSEFRLRWCGLIQRKTRDNEVLIEYEDGMTWAEFRESVYFRRLDKDYQKLLNDNYDFNYNTPEYDECVNEVVYPIRDDYSSDDEYDAAFAAAQEQDQICWDRYGHHVSANEEIISTDEDGYYYEYSYCTK